MTWSDRFASPASALCVGLDPLPDRMPAGLGVARFLAEVVEITAPFAACFKPNTAFFERLGVEGMKALADLLAALRRRGVPVIVDAKRGDIDSTAQAYADAYLGGPFDGDAVTVNPSVGLDAIEPFRRAARERDRGVLLLLRTSNPGAARFQDPAEAALVEAIGAEPAFGAVVGATDPAAGARLRAALPRTLFLVPGYGAQGGGAGLAGFFRDDGGGAVVNSSRAILYAGGAGADWRAHVEEAARRARDEIEQARRTRRSQRTKG